MLLSPLRNERKPLICSWCLRAHDLMCCGYLGDGALSPADLGVVFLADPTLLAAQPKKSGAARLEFVCFLPWAQVLCAPENFAVSLQQTLVFSSFVVGGSLLFTCRLFPLSPFPEAAKSQKALGAAHEQQGLRPARATRTRRATASAATKATGKHRQQSSREKQLGELFGWSRGQGGHISQKYGHIVTRHSAVPKRRFLRPPPSAARTRCEHGGKWRGNGKVN